MSPAITEPVEVEAHSFECPNCGATLVYEAESEKMACDYCDSEHEVQNRGEGDLQGLRERALQELFEARPHQRLPGARALECEQCGASTTIAEGSATGRCAFCASEMVRERDSKDQLAPSALIPFKVEKERAARLFKEWVGGLWFRPNDLKKMAQVAAIDGVYTPYFTFDAQAESRWRADSGTYYYEEESYRDAEGKNRTRQVRKTRWQPAQGHRRDSYDDVLVCGSKGLETELVRRLEPYGTRTELVAYQAEFLAGWRAEEYGLAPQEAWNRARKDIENTEYRACGSEIPGDTHRDLQVSTRLEQVTWKHVLLPVWIAAYRYQGNSYRFLVNGETGEVSGESPLSWWKIFFTVALLLFFVLTVAGSGGLALLPWAFVAMLAATVYGISFLTRRSNL